MVFGEYNGTTSLHRVYTKLHEEALYSDLIRYDTIREFNVDSKAEY